MILIPHSLVGAAVANLVPNDPALGFLLAFGSHYALDMIPHRDYDIDAFFDAEGKSFRSIWRNAKAAFAVLMIGGDFAVGAGLSVLLFAHNQATFTATLAGVAGGVFPDLLQFCYYTFKKKPWSFFQKIHDFFHHPDNMKDKPKRGIAFQIIASLAVLIAFFLLT